MRREKLTGLVLATTLFINTSPTTAYADVISDITELGNKETVSGTDYYVDNSNKTAVISKANKDILEIADKITISGDSYQVIGIADSAFEGSNISEISIPDSITYIGKNAFKDCVNLKKVTLPTTISALADACFSNCTKLREINTDNVISYGVGTFSGCESLTNIVLNAEVKSIPDECFMDCKSLDTCDLPERLRVIGDKAFENCESINSVTLPKSIERVGTESFYACSSLSQLDLNKINSAEIGVNAFARCIALEELKVINNSVKFNKGAFNSCSKLKSLEWSTPILPESAFQFCTSLSSVKLEGVEEIGTASFNGCQNLYSLDLPTTLKTVGRDAFASTKLSGDIVFGENLESIGSHAFAGTHVISYAFTGEDIPDIDDDALRTANKLVDYVKFPDSYKAKDNYKKFIDKLPVGIYSKYTKSSNSSEAKQVSDYTVIDLETAKSIGGYIKGKAVDTYVDKTYLISAENDGIIIQSTVLNTTNNPHSVTIKDISDRDMQLLIDDGQSLPNVITPIQQDKVVTGWSEDVTNITKDMVITPKYNQQTCKVTFKDKDGNIIKIVEVPKGKSCDDIPVLSDDIEKDFLEWDKDLSCIQSDIEVNPIYSKDKHRIVFSDLDNNALAVRIVPDGGSCNCSLAPRVDGKVFVGWDKDLSNIKENMIIYPTYEDIYYNVVFYGKNNVISYQKVKYGEKPEVPPIDDIDFVKWDKDITSSEKVTEYHAEYENSECKVTFFNEDNYIYTIKKLKYGEACEAPNLQVPANKEFIGWDKDLSNITGDINVKPLIKDKVFEVEFYDKENRLWCVQSVKYGQDCIAPTLPPIDGYDFMGWGTESSSGRLADLTNIRENVKVYPIYREKVDNTKASGIRETIVSMKNDVQNFFINLFNKI